MNVARQSLQVLNRLSSAASRLIAYAKAPIVLRVILSCLILFLSLSLSLFFLSEMSIGAWVERNMKWGVGCEKSLGGPCAGDYYSGVDCSIWALRF